MVRNPRDVKEQQSEPQSLPGPEASVHDVRFFLYHVLTFKGNKIAKRWPQWVLETVAFWDGDGTVLRQFDGDFARLCPVSAGYAKLDGKTTYAESPSGDCRMHIAQALERTIKNLKAKEENKHKLHQEWLAIQRGSRMGFRQPITQAQATQ
ncbi:hypothetical protein N0V90_003314 [Kalmusia sp. IMI 367209]|nr:hypothetical protein N0V90_003314 [Kalmusia sp. IMI 367209]